MINVKCKHCGKQIFFGDVRFLNVRVNIEASGFYTHFDSDCLCVNCLENLVHSIRMMMENQE